MSIEHIQKEIKGLRSWDLGHGDLLKLIGLSLKKKFSLFSIALSKQS